MDDITSKYYQRNSQEYFNSTVESDVSSIYERFCSYLSLGARILDIGCGSGRDIKAFLDRGYKAEGLDGSPELCKLAGSYTGANIRCADFKDINI